MRAITEVKKTKKVKRFCKEKVKSFYQNLWDTIKAVKQENF